MATHAVSAPAADLGWRTRTAVTVLCALAPDLDFAGGLFGQRWHQRQSHSIGAALIAGAAVSLFSLVSGSARWRGLGAAAFLGWTSHLVLDFMNVDTNPPIGIMALWPFSSDFFKFPWPIFMDIGRTLTLHTVRHNALAVAWEAVSLSLLLVVCWRGRKHPRR
jgi:membrane-bound metal-dependent hydrolase YbcI (DUF457 family)